MPWAEPYGLRGLTVYFDWQMSLSRLPSKRELVDLEIAYNTIAERGDAPAINAWSQSIEAGNPAYEVKEKIRGLLLLFERLAEHGLAPFTDGQVRHISPEPPPFDWSVLPTHLIEFKPWLEKFEHLRTEHDLFKYVEDANREQLRELVELKKLLAHEGQALHKWCEATNVKGNPAKNEAFQTEWLFLILDFADPRLQELPANSRHQNGSTRDQGRSH